ncbi:hypothetical protein RND81_08G034700 [Saponaria officinalis]|uniref:Uncharacterized protein n=1 Tax=Saponaria officinalis TaxID=3572 RepID=A0AAW1J4J6_SAPOF
MGLLKVHHTAAHERRKKTSCVEPHLPALLPTTTNQQISQNNLHQEHPHIEPENNTSVFLQTSRRKIAKLPIRKGSKPGFSEGVLPVDDWFGGVGTNQEGIGNVEKSDGKV